MILAFIATFIAGAFFLIGPLFSKFFKKYDKATDFITGVACAVAVGIAIFDLLPEAIESFAEFNGFLVALIIIGLIAVGFGISRLLEKVIPHHNHKHSETEINHDEHERYYSHLGIMTSISLMFHNVIEGIAIYSSSIVDGYLGIIFALGMALHNIPLSLQVANNFFHGKTKLFTKILIFTGLIISTPVGGGICYLLNNQINYLVIGVLMCITIGLLLYIIIFELFKEMLNNSDKLISFLGFLLGVGLVLISIFI